MTTTTHPRERTPISPRERTSVGTADRRPVRVLTGDRPTGALHLGHYFGSLQNRVRLQEQGTDLFVLIADYQVLTDRDIAADLTGHVEGLVLDYLAVGLEPERCTFFCHSAVPALNQLTLPFLSLVSVAELQRNPTVKDEIRASRRDQVSGLMFTYPVHQAADILFCNADLVPVGEDQLPHLELTRTIARRFNQQYGLDQQDGEVFRLPEPVLSDVPKLLGTDGLAKMSKSRGNAITLSASQDETAQLIKGAITDSERRISYDPVNRPQVSSLVLLAALCLGEDPAELADTIGDGGAAGLKKVATDAVNDYLRPIRVRRREYAADREIVTDLLRAGNARANGIAEATLDRVREAMGTVR